MKTPPELNNLRLEMAAAAQKAYDQWEQDENGLDPELGAGGICHEIADAIAGKLSEYGIEAATVSQSIGEQHVYAAALLADGIYAIDIPPSLYETGGGYVWKKIRGVILTGNDIIIELIERDTSRFSEITGDR